jgi:hypothetical protein
VAESVPPPGPIADHVFLAAVAPFVDRMAATDEWLDAGGEAAGACSR